MNALSVLLAAKSENAYAQLGLYDGIPGDPNDPYGPAVHPGGGDGVFAIVEAGRIATTTDGDSKFGFGVWYSTAQFDDFSGRARDGNGGAYWIATTPLSKGRSASATEVFVQVGFAAGGRNAVTAYTGGGLRTTGLVAARPEDIFSLGIAQIWLDDRYRALTATAGSTETTLEITYAAELTPWLTVQPDVQVIIDPAASAQLDDAVVLGVRVILSLP